MKTQTLGLVAIGILSVTVAMADPSPSVVTVQSDEADIRAGEGPIYQVVTQALQGQSLNVLSTDDDWLKVHADIKGTPVEGYVYKISLTDSKPDVSGLSGAGGFATVSDTEAAKGMEPDTAAYAKTKNLSPEPLQKLMAFRHDTTKLSAADFEAFEAQGHVGKQKK